jgi:YHS domain-containing protein
MRFLSWLLRAVILTIIVNMVLRLIFSRWSKSAKQGAAGNRMPGAPPQPERLGGTLVRDPHCGTYIIQERALRVGSGEQAHYFCSDVCRTAYFAAHPQ